jgi:hypothetical protein
MQEVIVIPEYPTPGDILHAMPSADWHVRGTRISRGRVTIWYSKGYLAEFAGQDLLGQGATPTEALAHLQEQIKGLIEALQEAL